MKQNIFEKVITVIGCAFMWLIFTIQRIKYLAKNEK